MVRSLTTQWVSDTVTNILFALHIESKKIVYPLLNRDIILVMSVEAINKLLILK